MVNKEGHHSQQVGEVYNGLHAALISEGLWEACRKVRARHHSASRAFQSQVRPYMLGQLVHCHLCNRRLRSQGSTTGGYYREMSSSRGFDDCPNARVGTRVQPLHDLMGELVKGIVLPADWREELTELIGEDEEITTLHDRRALGRRTAAPETGVGAGGFQR